MESDESLDENFKEKAPHEDGSAWDEALETFPLASIKINFFKNQIAYMAGDVVSGSVDVDLREPFDAHDLTVMFFGQERTHFIVPAHQIRS